MPTKTGVTESMKQYAHVFIKVVINFVSLKNMKFYQLYGCIFKILIFIALLY